MTEGIDLYYPYQGKLDNQWAEIEQLGIKFAIVKVSDGWATDKGGQSYYFPEFRQRGILIGAYHYYRHDVNAEYQATVFRNAIGDYEMDLPPALDVEFAHNPTFNGGHIRTTLKFIEDKFGRKPIIYTSASVWNSIGDTWAADYDLWVASYRDTAPYMPKVWAGKPWVIWQYSDKIQIAGKTIDRNYFNGSLEELQKYASGEPIQIDPDADPIPTTGERVKVVCPYLRLRTRPKLYTGTTLIAEIGQVFEKAGTTVDGDGVTWQPVKLPAGYGEGMGYISANPKYIKEV